MELFVINAGTFKLDGGAMFGVVPKSIWQKLNPPDENNMCTWALRCLLIKTGDRNILIDTGMGDKQTAKFFSYYYPDFSNSLLSSLAAVGLGPAHITDVILTHLHFDHCGGAIRQQEGKYVTVFPKATYWSHSAHWDWAVEPNAREKASFLVENIIPIKESGQLKFIDSDTGLLNGGIMDEWFFTEDISLFVANGHTQSMLLPKIKYKGRELVYMADLLPSVGHIPLPYIMGYDMFPLTTLQEKTHFLQLALEKNYVLFFEHDPVNECCTLEKTDRGIRAGKTFPLAEFIPS